MSANGAQTDRTPLSVLLFHAAMQRQQSLSTFADELDIGAISLRQFILGKTQRPRQKTLETIGQALGMPVEEVRQRMSFLPEAAAPFGEWLDGQMKARGKLSRARLTRETKISDGALRNYLSNQTLPDSDQAQRLAVVLEVDPMTVAGVIVANEVAEKGGELAPPRAEQPDGAPESAEADGVAALALGPGSGHDESQLLGLWRQLHPQGRRATLGYIAMLLAER